MQLNKIALGALPLAAVLLLSGIVQTATASASDELLFKDNVNAALKNNGILIIVRVDEIPAAGYGLYLKAS